jgi:hypothetical protein
MTIDCRIENRTQGLQNTNHEQRTNGLRSRAPMIKNFTAVTKPRNPLPYSLDPVFGQFNPARIKLQIKYVSEDTTRLGTDSDN